MDIIKILTKNYLIVLLFSKLIVGAIAVFFGILVWNKTRKNYIVLFVLGIFSIYIFFLIQSLNYFGFNMLSYFNIEQFVFILDFFELIPIILFIASLCLFLKSEDF